MTSTLIGMPVRSSSTFSIRAPIFWLSDARVEKMIAAAVPCGHNPARDDHVLSGIVKRRPVAVALSTRQKHSAVGQQRRHDPAIAMDRGRHPTIRRRVVNLGLVRDLLRRARPFITQHAERRHYRQARLPNAVRASRTPGGLGRRLVQWSTDGTDRGP